MTADVGRDERAGGHDAQAAGPRVVECPRREAAAEPASFEFGQDHGVHEDDPALAEPVLGEADQLAVEPRLVAAGVGSVDDPGALARRVVHRQVELRSVGADGAGPGRSRLVRYAIVPSRASASAVPGCAEIASARTGWSSGFQVRISTVAVAGRSVRMRRCRTDGESGSRW